MAKHGLWINIGHRDLAGYWIYINIYLYIQKFFDDNGYTYKNNSNNNYHDSSYCLLFKISCLLLISV